MNKSTFITLVAGIKPASYNYDQKNGYEACRQEVLKLANELDESGMTIETYRLFREQVEESRALFEELFTLQKQLADNSRETFTLQKEIREKNEEALQLKDRLKIQEQSCVPKTWLLDIIKTVTTEKATFEEAILILKNRFNIDILSEGEYIK